jgi:hypothetical protein
MRQKLTNHNSNFKIIALRNAHHIIDRSPDQQLHEQQRGRSKLSATQMPKVMGSDVHSQHSQLRTVAHHEDDCAIQCSGKRRAALTTMAFERS